MLLLDSLINNPDLAYILSVGTYAVLIITANIIGLAVVHAEKAKVKARREEVR